MYNISLIPLDAQHNLRSMDIRFGVDEPDLSGITMLSGVYRSSRFIFHRQSRYDSMQKCLPLLSLKHLAHDQTSFHVSRCFSLYGTHFSSFCTIPIAYRRFSTVNLSIFKNSLFNNSLSDRHGSYSNDACNSSNFFSAPSRSLSRTSKLPFLNRRNHSLQIFDEACLS